VFSFNDIRLFIYFVGKLHITLIYTWYITDWKVTIFLYCMKLSLCSPNNSSCFCTAANEAKILINIILITLCIVMYLVNIYINNHKTLNTCLTKSNSFISMQSIAKNIQQDNCDQKVEDIAKIYTFLYKYKNKKNKYK